MAKLITLGTLTSTGGKIITASSNMTINGKKVVKLGDIGTCKCGKKSCRGQGKIYRKGVRKITIDGTELAKGGDPIDTGCGTCFVSDPVDMVCIGELNSQGIIISGNGANIQLGDNIFLQGAAAGQAPISTQKSSVTQASLISQGDSIVPPELSLENAAQQAYDLTETEWNKDLQDDLKEYLEGRHTQVCIFTVDDAAKCALNLWHQKNKEGETFGKDVLDALEYIHSKIDIGVGLIAAAKVSKALGGLGVMVKQFVDSKGVERIIISSLWNDSKMHYAVVNGLNIKKNHPYRVTNPTIKQLGVLAEDTVNGFKKGAVLSLIVSAAINTNELVFNDDYHLVDWCGSMGSDLFKVMVSLAASTGLVSLFVLFGLSVPLLVSFLVFVLVDAALDLFWDEFEIEEKLTNELKTAVK